MMALITDQQHMMSQGQLAPDMVGKRVPGGVDNIDHHPRIRTVPLSAAEKARQLSDKKGLLHQRALPLVGQRDRGHHDFHRCFRKLLPQPSDRFQRQNGLSSTGRHMRDTPVSVLLPGAQAFFLPSVKLHGRNLVSQNLMQISYHAISHPRKIILVTF